MRVLINLMIFGGSALMVWNILRYASFMKRNAELEKQSSRTGLLLIPQILLIFFLIGYVVVGLSGIADLMMASILLGGSIFVFLMLREMFTIIERVKDTDNILSLRYQEMRAELDAIMNESIASFQVNLTKDTIEERSGQSLYDSDLEYDSYTEMMAARGSNIIDAGYGGNDHTLFTREGLIQHYHDGQTKATEILLVRLKDGEPSFVKFEAALTMMPVSGDIMAFITETPYNDDVITRTIVERVMMDRYDRIAYLIDGRFHEVISNYGRKEGLLLPDGAGDTYESLYLNYILPTMRWDPDRIETDPNPLRLSVIDKALEESGKYEVNGVFDLEDGTHSKNIAFYNIDEKAKFYLMLVADTTDITGPALTESHDESADAEGSARAETETASQAETDVPEAAEPSAPSEADMPAAEVQDEPAPAGSYRVLLADDNAVNREIGQLMLSSEGFDVDIACDGKEALDIISSSPAGTYDAVLMDMHMPVMDGCESARAIRALADAELACVPIIALTASTEQESVDEVLSAGMDSFASKPIDPALIRDTIRGILGGRS